MERMATAGAVLSAEAHCTHQYTVHIRYAYAGATGELGWSKVTSLGALNQLCDDIVDSNSRYMGSRIAYCGLISTRRASS